MKGLRDALWYATAWRAPAHVAQQDVADYRLWQHSSVCPDPNAAHCQALSRCAQTRRNNARRCVTRGATACATAHCQQRAQKMKRTSKVATDAAALASQARLTQRETTTWMPDCQAMDAMFSVLAPVANGRRRHAAWARPGTVSDRFRKQAHAGVFVRCWRAGLLMEEKNIMPKHEHRPSTDSGRCSYPTGESSDLTNTQWAAIELTVTSSSLQGGYPAKTDRRAIMNALIDKHRTGFQWCMLPADVPPMSAD